MIIMWFSFIFLFYNFYGIVFDCLVNYDNFVIFFYEENRKFVLVFSMIDLIWVFESLEKYFSSKSVLLLMVCIFFVC